MRKSYAVGVMSALAMTMSTHAAVVTQWTFETSVPTTAGPHAAEVGAGSATGFHASGSVVYSNPVGNGSSESFSSNFWATGDYYQFQTSSTGLSNLAFSFDQTRSSTGPADFNVEWSTDGGTWNTLASYVVPQVSWSSITPDGTLTTSFGPYALPAAMDNQPAIYLRLTNKSATGATGGTNRVDNVTITPEPASLLVLALGGLLMTARRRRA